MKSESDRWIEHLKEKSGGDHYIRITLGPDFGGNDPIMVGPGEPLDNGGNFASFSDYTIDGEVAHLMDLVAEEGPFDQDWNRFEFGLRLVPVEDAYRSCGGIDIPNDLFDVPPLELEFELSEMEEW